MSFIRPKANSVFNCNSSKGLKFVRRLRLGLSHLRELKFNHTFQDPINPLCSCSLDVESTMHYFLHCPLLTIKRYTLLNKISQIDTFINYLVYSGCIFFSLYVRVFLVIINIYIYIYIYVRQKQRQLKS